MSDSTMSTTTREESTTTRRGPTTGRVRTALEDAIRRPVKDAVREALAEGTRDPSDGSDARDEPTAVDASGTTEGAGSESVPPEGDAATASETSRSLPRRILGSRRAVVFLAVVAATYLRRRRSSASAE